MKILVTGSAGFIGYHLCNALLKSANQVVGVDNLNDYYDVKLKKDRLSRLEKWENFRFVYMSIEDRDGILKLFKEEKFEYVVNLAAQAGVRYSLSEPYKYIDSNIVGFINILEGCRHFGVKHLIFASSSSVYGLNAEEPFSVHHCVDHPISLYAATKRANELLAHTYSYLFEIPATGLRFFTVYGPWGRPDMVLFKFTGAILKDVPIDVYNYGKAKRDFTFIDDVVEALVRVIQKIPQSNPNWTSDKPDPATSVAPFRIYNIGNNNPTDLIELISILESCLGKKAKKNFLPLPPGDVPSTFADIDDSIADFGFRPRTTIREGIEKFVEWYFEYYGKLGAPCKSFS